jgi:hypothetical protein
MPPAGDERGPCRLRALQATVPVGVDMVDTKTQHTGTRRQEQS